MFRIAQRRGISLTVTALSLHSIQPVSQSARQSVSQFAVPPYFSRDTINVQKTQSAESCALAGLFSEAPPNFDDYVGVASYYLYLA